MITDLPGIRVTLSPRGLRAYAPGSPLRPWLTSAFAVGDRQRLAAVEDGTHGIGQLLRTVGFADETEHAFLLSLGHVLGGIAAREQYVDVWVDLQQPVQRVAAGKTRHRQVENDQVDAVLLAAVDVEGFQSVLG